MDIKSKKFNIFSGLKIFLVLLMITSVVIMIPCLSYVSNVVGSDFEKYDETYQFEESFNNLLHNVVEYNVVLISEEHIIKSTGRDSYTQAQNELNQVPGSNVDETIEAGQSDVDYKLDRLHTIEEHLANTVNFIYYIENVRTKEIITNIEEEDPEEFIKQQTSYVYYNQYKAENEAVFNYNDDILRMLKGTDYEVHAAVYKSLRIGDDFFIQNAQFNQLMKNYPMISGILIISGIVFLISFGLLLKIIGRDPHGGIVDSALDKIYNEFQIGIALISIVATEGIVEPVLNIFLKGYNDNLFYNMSLANYMSIALTINILLLLGLSFLRQCKSKKILKNTITYEIVKLCFKTKYFKPGIILVFTAYVLINAIIGIFLLVTLNSGTSLFFVVFFVFVGFNVVAFVFLQKSLQSLNTIMEVTKQVSQGNFQDVVDKERISLSFRDFYTDIVSIKDGMKDAVQEAIKGERLKTELITNVSHDLKTPLTSIINYVDLLKREDLQGEKAVEYVKILDEKSARLKQLIEDLLEASKASSGNLTVEFQELDLNELIQQAVGECEEKFKNNDLEIKLHLSDKDVPIFGDSKHMWRIAENLLTNAIKYAMPHTRVYIDTAIKEGFGITTIKNVSAKPLDISPEQLTQRFVRGDESRTTEGSGLGLSIAESLTNIQGGKFIIDIDGDLFKVTVLVPLMNDHADNGK